ncbi:helix-turn-helix domain-containing protein [Brevibacillus nitrificans]|uniref:Helix-turn-helix domain-containing protein n=1 Tax=Brevibacillus nitrificans TaxID=651560 RepID=A0A3M8D8A5_9BACL|nr:AraC family transcriptional regulator [Brevibacillus nitrificans]RNB83899.1 helix-turn-helix domain-containing protein [Brevibacillus nitrificans]
MSFQDQLMLWNHAALKVVDVRRSILAPGEVLPPSKLAASTFLCTVRGRAQLWLDQTAYGTDLSPVCHAGKGTSFTVVEVSEPLEYYMILYKASLTMPCREELLRMQRASDPFQSTFGFAPHAPFTLLATVEKLYQQWLTNSALDKLHAKSLFHQFIYETLQQLSVHKETTTSQRLLEQAVQFMEENYAQKISLDLLANQLGCNARQLQRLFKAELQIGPMEYLLRLRLERAKDLLTRMQAPLIQIAEAVGYSDSYYFSRMFKKYSGLSPSQFREQAVCRYNPSGLSPSYIVSQKTPMYSVTDENAIHYQYQSAASSPGTREAHRLVQSKGGVTEATLRTISHRKGELDLAHTPEKIVVLDYQYIDQLYSLGHLPIGSVFGTSDTSILLPENLARQLGEIKRLGTKDEPDLAAIAEISPELIICTQIHEHVYDELAAIAPTVMLDRNEDWRVSLPVLGKMLGKEKEAQKVIDDYNQKIVSLKDALAAKMNGKTVSLIRPRDNMIRLHTTAHRTAKILYRDLGMAAPSMAIDSKRTSSFIGLDAMTELNADHLFVLKDDSNEELTREYQKSAIWKGLRVVKANQVSTFNTTMWIGYYGPIAINRVVDQIAEALL